MKVAQLEVGQTYQDKKGLRRTIREMSGDKASFTPNEVYYVEEGSGYIHHIGQQKFAAWARSKAAPFPGSHR